jgi:hypothetical protein
LSGALHLIELNRRKGQTTRLVEVSASAGSLLVTGNHEHASSLKNTWDGVTGLQVCSVQNLGVTRGTDFKGGVVFDNFALSHLFNVAISEISEHSKGLTRMGSEIESLKAELAAAKAENEALKSEALEVSVNPSESGSRQRPSPTTTRTSRARSQTPEDPRQLHMFDSETEK